MDPIRPPRPAGGVPPRPNPLPPPRATAGSTSSTSSMPRPDPRTSRPVAPVRQVTRGRRARLVLKRVDPWSVFLFTVVWSIFLGIALVIAVALLYATLSRLGVLSSVNKLIGDVTAEPGTTSTPSTFFTAGKILTLTALIAALNVVLLTALATIGAFLYNLCASMTGGIEVTLSDRD
jgi:hypothetical protein